MPSSPRSPLESTLSVRKGCGEQCAILNHAQAAILKADEDAAVGRDVHCCWIRQSGDLGFSETCGQRRSLGRHCDHENKEYSKNIFMHFVNPGRGEGMIAKFSRAKAQRRKGKPQENLTFSLRLSFAPLRLCARNQPSDHGPESSATISRTAWRASSTSS